MDQKIENFALNLDIHDTVYQAKQLINDNNLNSLMILNGDKYVGLLSNKNLSTITESTYLYDVLEFVNPVFLFPDFTLFDWLRVNATIKTEFIPIINPKDKTLLYTLNHIDFLEKFNSTGLYVESSTILLLRKSTNDFSYSEVFQIAESHGAKIFGSYIKSSSQNYTDIVVNLYHLGLNELLQSYRRFDYEVISFHDEDLHQETLKANSDYFNKYLNL